MKVDPSKFFSDGIKTHEEFYERVAVIPDERTLLNSSRYSSCAKCGKRIQPNYRWRVEYEGGPPIYFHEQCFYDVEKSLDKVYEAAVQSVLKNHDPNIRLPGEG